jgi:hypothetical protein
MYLATVHLGTSNAELLVVAQVVSSFASHLCLASSVAWNTYQKLEDIHSFINQRLSNIDNEELQRRNTDSTERKTKISPNLTYIPLQLPLCVLT